MLALTVQANSWARQYSHPGTGSLDPRFVVQMPDGGLAAAGTTDDGSGDTRLAVLRLASSGEILWQKEFSVPDAILTPSALASRQDGSLLIAADRRIISGNQHLQMLFSLDADGSWLWGKRERSQVLDRVDYLVVTEDGGFLAGKDRSIAKFDATSQPEWGWHFELGPDDSGLEFFGDIKQTSDGGFVIAGQGGSVGGAFLLKTNPQGVIEWSRNYRISNVYGQNAHDIAAIVELADGSGYAMTGHSNEVWPAPEDYCQWILKVSPEGWLRWQYGHVPPDWERSRGGATGSLLELPNGDLVASGFLSLVGADETISVIALSRDGALRWQKEYRPSRRPRIRLKHALSDGSFLVASSPWVGDPTTIWKSNATPPATGCNSALRATTYSSTSLSTRVEGLIARQTEIMWWQNQLPLAEATAVFELLPDCSGPESLCGNGIDDDGDGLPDCIDPDCEGVSPCSETDCSNGIDGDGDGLIDCEDDDCAISPDCADEDHDGDGIPNGEDCAPLDPGDGSPVPELTALMVHKEGADWSRLDWAEPPSGMTDPEDSRYLIISGLVTELWRDRGFDSACGWAGSRMTTELDARLGPGLDEAFYYLVLGENDCGEGDTGTSSVGLQDARSPLIWQELPACP